MALRRNRELFFLLRAAEGRIQLTTHYSQPSGSRNNRLIVYVPNSFKMVSFVNILVYLVWTLSIQQMYSVSISWWKQVYSSEVFQHSL